MHLWDTRAQRQAQCHRTLRSRNAARVGSNPDNVLVGQLKNILCKEGWVKKMDSEIGPDKNVMKRVSEIMVPIEQFPAIRDNTSLREALRVIETVVLGVELRKALPRALLVYDEIDVFVGYLRRRDIMRGLEPPSLVAEPLDYRRKLFDVAVDPNLSEMSWDHVVSSMRSQGDRPVSDVMRPIAATIEADDHVIKAINEMVSMDLNLIPVLKDGMVVGVVRSVDAFHELARLMD